MSTPDLRPVLDPRTQWFLKFLKDSGRPQVFEVPLAEARLYYVRAQELFAGPLLPAHIEDRTIPVGPRGDVQLRIVRAEGSGSGQPVLMYFHGGGWVLGDGATYDRFLRELAHGTGATVVFVEYRRSPEERFPVPLEECYAATAWVAERGAELGVDAARIAVAGDSAGGNMATVVCRLAIERNGPKIASQVLIYPATAAGFDLPSIREFAQDHYLTLENSRWFWHQYAPDRSADSDPNACPLLTPLDQLKSLPPALVITAECDILRDEGEAYARKLSQAGVPVTCTRYLGAIHGFMGINALTETPANRAAMDQVCTALKKALFAEVRMKQHG